MNIAHLLRRSALLYAHQPALLYGDQVLWTYGTLAARTAALAAHLRTRCGVAPGGASCSPSHPPGSPPVP